jgi:manganese/zinc/iron transport system permease protein
MTQVWESILYDGNTQWVLLSTLLLGIASGVLGSFALLRKQSLIGDAVAHAALPGICFAFMFTGEKNLFALLIGAAATGLLAAYTIQFIRNTTRIKEDTAICLVLSVFFGLGIVLLTRVSQMATGNKSGLDDFIFGQAASLVGRDVQLMGITATMLIIVTALLFKEFKVSTFDPEFAKGIGLPVGFLNFLFSSLLVTTVVIGIQAVGVILMAALLITPAISARYWTNSLQVMVVLSGVIGGVSGMVGTLISTLGKGLSTGPFIVLTASFIFIVSIFFSPSRGLVSLWWKRRRNDDRIVKKQLLKKLYDFGDTSLQELRALSTVPAFRIKRILGNLMNEQLVNYRNGMISITQKGREMADRYILVDYLLELVEMYPNELGSFDISLLEKQEEQGITKEEYRSLHNHLSSLHKQHPFLNIQGISKGGETYEL